MKNVIKLIILLNSIFQFNFRYHNPTNFLICNKINCPQDRGVCTRDNKCVCIGDYITSINLKEKYGNYQCNYPQANQSKVFILEFLLSFGAGHFYLGNFPIAIIKFIFCLCTAILLSISPCLAYNQIKHKTYDNILMGMGFIWIIWQIIDGTLIAMNYYVDRNGVPMKLSLN